MARIETPNTNYATDPHQTLFSATAREGSTAGAAGQSNRAPMSNCHLFNTGPDTETRAT